MSCSFVTGGRMWVITICDFAALGEFSIFCFKQKTAYEVRISDWSSDVCSSDRPRLISIGAGLEGSPGARRTFYGVVTDFPRPDEIGRAACTERGWQYV